MKLHTLQLYLRSLVEPLAASSAGPAVDDLRRACDLLGTMSEMHLGEFSSTLEQMKAYQLTREHAVPPSLRAFVSSFESLRSLKGKASQPEANREEIARDLALVPLDSFKAAELIQLASDSGLALNGKPTKAPAVLDAIWTDLTGASKPKAAKKPAAPRKKKDPVPPVDVVEYAQKISGLKDRAISPDSTREELEKSLAELKLAKIPKAGLLAIAKQLSCDVNAKTPVKKLVEALEDVVLGAKEMVVGGAG